MPDLHGPIRARDLRYNIKELGFEQGVVKTMELFLDEFASHRQDMREVVAVLDQAVEAITRMNIINDGMAKQMDAIKRGHDQGDAIDGA